MAIRDADSIADVGSSQETLGVVDGAQHRAQG